MGRLIAVLVAAAALVRGGPAEAQLGIQGTGVGQPTNYGYQPGYAGGYQINNGVVGSGYRASYGLNQRATINSAPLTVTNYQPIISAITSLPGWYGPAGGGPVARVERPKPTVPETSCWRPAAPSDGRAPRRGAGQSRGRGGGESRRGRARQVRPGDRAAG